MQWGASPDRQGVFREFRFRDPNVEQKYRHWLQDWCVGPIRCHAALVLALSSLSMPSYYTTPWRDLPASFWSHCFPISAAIGLLLLLCLQQRVSGLKPALIPVFSVFCATTTAHLAFLLWQWPREWHAHALRSDLALVAAAPLPPDARQQLSEYLLRAFLPSATSTCMMLNLPQLTFLSIVAFGRWTTLAAWVMVPAFSLAIINFPGWSMFLFADSVVRMCVLCGACTVLGAQLSVMRRSNFLAELIVTQQLHTSEMADSVLNHGLKNTMADAASNVELFLSGELPASALQDSLISLRRGMRSCKERQLYLKLVAGEYPLLLQPTNLEDLGQQLIAGRQVVGHFSPHTVMLDPMLCSLIFDNAINNAFRHGHPQAPAVHFSIGEDEATPPSYLQPDRVRLVMVVTNRANPSRPPLTNDFVALAASGRSPSLPCEADMSPLSDRIGLSHCFLAARQHGMQLSLTQDGDTVRFVVVYDTPMVRDRRSSAPPAEVPAHVLRQFPTGLHFRCLDDSLASRHLLHFHISKYLSPGSVECVGEAEVDVETFVGRALEEADVVVLDQHLEYTHSYLGIDLLRQLRDGGFPGLLCMRSANATPLDVALYHRSGAHCVFGKDLPGPAMAEQIRAAWVRLSREGAVRARPPSRPDCYLLAAVDPREDSPTV